LHPPVSEFDWFPMLNAQPEFLLQGTRSSVAGRDFQNGLIIKRKRGQKVTNFFTLFFKKINMAGKKGKIIQ
jgi:hypothetical protein